MQIRNWTVLHQYYIEGMIQVSHPLVEQVFGTEDDFISLVMMNCVLVDLLFIHMTVQTFLSV